MLTKTDKELKIAVLMGVFLSDAHNNEGDTVSKSEQTHGSIQLRELHNYYAMINKINKNMV